MTTKLVNNSVFLFCISSESVIDLILLARDLRPESRSLISWWACVNFKWIWARK